MASEVTKARESTVNPINATSSRSISAEERSQIRQMVREAQSEADDILYDTLSQIGREDLYGRDIQLQASYDADDDMTYFYLIERGSGSESQKFDIDGSRAALEDEIWRIARRH